MIEDTRVILSVARELRARLGEGNFEVKSATPNDIDFSFDGYTFFPMGEGVPSPYSTGDFTHIIINADRGWMPSSMHHEVRHLLIGDFGRQVPFAAHHGVGNVDQETREAEKEAVQNHRETLR